ncbi:Putative membrane protein OS=Streptomyces violarus OX=67380 GN=FHS41_004291 PE=3 SV=1 [Streptomyces violarus]
MPLAALARPKWRDFLIWQVCEVAYFLGIWMYLAYTTSGDAHKGLPTDGYRWAIGLHLLGALYLCVMVVRDIFMPDRDPVRRSGDDDPRAGARRRSDVFVSAGRLTCRARRPFGSTGRGGEWGRRGATGGSL